MSLLVSPMPLPRRNGDSCQSAWEAQLAEQDGLQPVFEANRQGSIIAIGRLLADATIVVLGQVIGDDAVDPTIPTPPSARRSCERAELSWCKEGGRSRKFLTFSVVFETHWFAMLASEMNNAKYKFCRKHHSSFVISKGLCSSY